MANMTKVKKQVLYGTVSKYFSDHQIKNAVDFYRNDLGWQYYVTDEEALSLLLKDLSVNPYSLIKIPYITVAYMDALCVRELPKGHKYHIDYDDQRRIDAMVVELLKDQIHKGRALVDRVTFLAGAVATLVENTPDEHKHAFIGKEYADCLMDSTVYKSVYNKTGKDEIVLRSWADMNDNLMNILNRLSSKGSYELDENRFSQAIFKVESKNKFKYDEYQLECIQDMIENYVSLTCGYAGTGKSTCIKGVVEYLSRSGFNTLGCAISAKACSNLRSIVGDELGFEVKTIASILMRGKPALEGVKYLIIDEISMVGEDVLYQILRCLDRDTHVIMLGDKAQLPAISTVGFLTSFLDTLDDDSDFCYHELTKVYRQQDQSDLLKHATKIRCQEHVDVTLPTDGSLKYVKVNDKTDVLKITSLAIDKYGLDVVSILTPLNKDVKWFNKRMQHLMCTKRKVNESVNFKSNTFFKGDKVLVKRNMHAVQTVDGSEVDIYNGLLGRVIEVVSGKDSLLNVDRIFNPVEASHLVVQFEINGKLVDVYFYDDEIYTFEDYAEISGLDLGYAMTAHKSQGSTIDAVIYYLSKSTNYSMTNKELLYTSLTRARYKLIFATDAFLRPDLLNGYINKSAYDTCNSYLKFTSK